MTRIALMITLLLCSPSAVAMADIFVNIRMEVDDLSGHPISSIAVGGDFKWEMFAQDVRVPPPVFGGLFAAFANTSYDSSLASVTGPIVHAPFFTLVPSGDASVPGLISGAGGASFSLSPPGTAEQLVLSVPFHATAPGLLAFVPSFDSISGHDVLVYGYDFGVTADQIDFISTSLAVVPEPSSMVLAAIGLLAVGAWKWRRRTA